MADKNILLKDTTDNLYPLTKKDNITDLADINPKDLSSGTATNGQVPIANGSGGIAWGSPSGGGGLQGYTVTLTHKSGNKLFMVYSDNSYELITMSDNNAHTYNNVICFYLDISHQAYAELVTGGGNGYLVTDVPDSSTYSQIIVQLGGLSLYVRKYTVYGSLTAHIYGGGGN